MKNYIVDFKFYAGSDDPEDIDRKNVLVSVDDSRTGRWKAPDDISLRRHPAEKLVRALSRLANKWLDPYQDTDVLEKSPIEFTYNEGLNLDTLVEGMNIIGEKKGIKVEILDKRFFKPIAIDGMFSVEQWQ
jgi:hypothetical protein